MAGRHEWEFEERRSSPIKYLNVHRVDLLQLLDQCCMIVCVQDLRKGKDEITSEGDADVGRLKNCQCAPELVDARLL